MNYDAVYGCGRCDLLTLVCQLTAGWLHRLHATEGDVVELADGVRKFVCGDLFLRQFMQLRACTYTIYFCQESRWI